MSRHLMAKFRREAAQQPLWQHGVMPPDTADHMKHYNTRERWMADEYPWKPKHVCRACLRIKSRARRDRERGLRRDEG